MPSFACVHRLGVCSSITRHRVMSDRCCNGGLQLYSWIGV
eukprot:XP_001705649.1 Hypothetical protein GL50803_38018 [Giardia lamblia ATCC 50803]